jgi:hypothetical protein
MDTVIVEPHDELNPVILPAQPFKDSGVCERHHFDGFNACFAYEAVIRLREPDVVSSVKPNPSSVFRHLNASSHATLRAKTSEVYHKKVEMSSFKRKDFVLNSFRRFTAATSPRLGGDGSSPMNLATEFAPVVQRI